MSPRPVWVTGGAGPIEPELERVGRYTIFRELAHGGTATVFLAVAQGEAGFHRVVAIKRLHQHYAQEDQFVSMLIDEARMTGRISHTNVVPVLDVVKQNEDLHLVMEYVHGESLARLIFEARRAGALVPPPIAAAIMVGALHGLHAAHEARDQHGLPLGIVHRDVSPQNLMVGIDGVPRVLDFGVAKARGRLAYTIDGTVKGKVGYMAPEQLLGKALDRRADVYAAGVVLWEALVGDRLVDAGEDGQALAGALAIEIRRPGDLVRGVPRALDHVVLRACSRASDDRFSSALVMAREIEQAIDLSPSSEVSRWVQTTAAVKLREKRRLLDDLDARIVEITQTRFQVATALMPVPDVATGAAGLRAHGGAGPARPGWLRSRIRVAAFGASLVAVSGITALLLAPVRPAPAKNVAAAFAERPPHEVGAAASRPPDRPPILDRQPTSTEKPTVEKPRAPAPTVVSSSRRRIRPARPQVNKVKCDPPYTTDAAGIRRYKPDCVR